MLTVCIILAVFVTVFLVWRQAKEYLYDEGSVFDTILLCVISGLLFGRIGHVVLHSDIFGLSFLRMAAFWVYPGVYLYTGVIGVIAALWVQARKSKELEFWKLLDMVGYAFWVGLLISYIGIFLAGVETGFPSHIQGVPHPVSLYKLVVLLALLIPYAVFRADFDRDDVFHKTTGSVGLGVILIFSLSSFVIDFLKIRETYAELSVDQWGALVLFLLSAMTLYIRWKTTHVRESRLQKIGNLLVQLLPVRQKRKGRRFW